MQKFPQKATSAIKRCPTTKSSSAEAVQFVLGHLTLFIGLLFAGFLLASISPHPLQLFAASAPVMPSEPIEPVEAPVEQSELNEPSDSLKTSQDENDDDGSKAPLQTGIGASKDEATGTNPSETESKLAGGCDSPFAPPACFNSLDLAQKSEFMAIIFNFSASRSDVKKNLESWIAQTLTTNDQKCSHEWLAAADLAKKTLNVEIRSHLSPDAQTIFDKVLKVTSNNDLPYDEVCEQVKEILDKADSAIQSEIVMAGAGSNGSVHCSTGVIKRFKQLCWPVDLLPKSNDDNSDKDSDSKRRRRDTKILTNSSSTETNSKSANTKHLSNSTSAANSKSTESHEGEDHQKATGNEGKSTEIEINESQETKKGKSSEKSDEKDEETVDAKDKIGDIVNGKNKSDDNDEMPNSKPADDDEIEAEKEDNDQKLTKVNSSDITNTSASNETGKASGEQPNSVELPLYSNESSTAMSLKNNATNSASIESKHGD